MDEKFWQLQKTAGLSNKECAEFIGVSKRTIERYRSGELKAPESCIKNLKYFIKYGDIK